MPYPKLQHLASTGGFIPNGGRPWGEVNHNGLFAYFNELVRGLPYFFENRRMNDLVVKLPIFTVQNLTDGLQIEEREALRRDFAFLVAAYYHTHDSDASSPVVIPSKLGMPLVYLSDKTNGPVGMPTLTYYHYALANFYRLDISKPFDAENIRMLRNFVAVMDEQWFMMLHVAIEARVGDLLKYALGALNVFEVQEIDEGALIHNLNQMAGVVSKMVNVFEDMPLGCSPDVYHLRVRKQIMPFRRIVFDGVRGFDEPRDFVAGETGAQSCIAPTLDAFLRISHGMTRGYDYVKEMRRYMPPAHLAMIQEVESSSVDFRVFCGASGNRILEDAFNNLVEQFAAFRALHYRYAREYIFEKVKDHTGTGGTPASIWLKQLHDTTLAHRI